jgi:hypothetical protein
MLGKMREIVRQKECWLDEPHSSCPDLVLATDRVQHADEIIQKEQHVPYGELWLQLRSSAGTRNIIA